MNIASLIIMLSQIAKNRVFFEDSLQCNLWGDGESLTDLEEQVFKRFDDGVTHDCIVSHLEGFINLPREGEEGLTEELAFIASSVKTALAVGYTKGFMCAICVIDQPNSLDSRVEGAYEEER